MENFEIFGVPSLKKGSGIHIKKKNRGKFTEYCDGEVTQKCIDKAKKSGNKTLVKRAIFAENSRKWSKHLQGGLILKYQKAGKLSLKFIDDVSGIAQGCKAGTEQCALFQNRKFRDNGYYVRGNAWNLVGDKMIFNGYNGLDSLDSYDRAAVEQINKNASRNVYDNFDSRALNKEQPYIVNMYYQGSPYQETAFNDGDGVYGTHTGILTYDNNAGRWIVTHNIHNKVHKDDFIALQGGKGKYGVTAISTPRKPNLFNKVLYKLGFKEGGIVKFQEPAGPINVGGVTITPRDPGTITTAPSKWQKFKQRASMIGEAVSDLAGLNPEAKMEDEALEVAGDMVGRAITKKAGYLGMINSAPNIVGNIEQIKKGLNLPYHQALIDNKDTTMTQMLGINNKIKKIGQNSINNV